MRRKTDKMRRLEQAHNQPIIELLRHLYAQTGSVTGVAEHLHVSVSTVSNWLARFDIPTRATITPSEFLFQEEPSSANGNQAQAQQEARTEAPAACMRNARGPGAH